jgi:hypothetical protein
MGLECESPLAGRARKLSKIVDRALDVFEMFAAEKRRLSLTDMSRLLVIPPRRGAGAGGARLHL